MKAFYRLTFMIIPVQLICTIATAQDESKNILAIHRTFQHTVLQRDSVNIGKLYADSAVSMRQNEPIRTGRQAIEDRWRRAFRMAFALKLTTEKLVITSSSSAFQYGLFEVKSTDAEPKLLATGKWMIVWKKENTDWKIALEMDNFNAAAPK